MLNALKPLLCITSIHLLFPNVCSQYKVVVLGSVVVWVRTLLIFGRMAWPLCQMHWCASSNCALVLCCFCIEGSQLIPGQLSYLASCSLGMIIVRACHIEK